MDSGSSARERDSDNHMAFSHEDNTTTPMVTRGTTNSTYYNNKLPNFSNYSSSPSSSSSSPHYKTTAKSFISPGGGGGGEGGPTSWGGDGSSIDHDHHNHQMMMMMNGPDTKLELMNSNSPRSSVVVVEREHMFDKVVTPSDVGKLNRLVIPKQHAEKYFPLDSSTNEKGLLLNFEDRNGKPWRFRYSYWNSSQSYVMTKGWSRFVKEKKLDAGDIVSFQRGVGDKDRLFIDWRRRPDATPPDHSAASINIPFSFHHHHHRSIPWSHSQMRPHSLPMNYGTIFNLHPYRNAYGGGGGGGGSGIVSTNGGGRGGGGGGCYNGYGNAVCSAGPVFYLRPSGPASGAAGAEHPMGMVQPLHHPGVQQVEVYNSVPVVHGKAAAAGKRLRLFGVNMECSPTSDGQSEECELNSSHHHHHHHLQQHDQLPQFQLSSSPYQTTSSQAAVLDPLRLYNGTPIPGISTVDFLNKGKAAASTFNFDI